MKKFFVFLAAMGIMAFSAQYVSAENKTQNDQQTEQATPADSFVNEAETLAEETEEAGIPLHQALKTKFIEGGVGFMAAIIACLILGLAIAIERILYLNLSTVNHKKLLNKFEAALEEGGIEAAKELCFNTRGPIASIFYQGLLRYDEGIENVEKAVVSYGSVKNNEMEKGLTWLSLFIAMSTNLGFLGTVLGMIEAFDAIQKAGDISPNVVAGGMKVALITTVGGLIVALILQVFYNYILSKIDSLTNEMEDASISFIDILVKHNEK